MVSQNLLPQQCRKLCFTLRIGGFLKIAWRFFKPNLKKNNGDNAGPEIYYTAAGIPSVLFKIFDVVKLVLERVILLLNEKVSGNTFTML